MVKTRSSWILGAALLASVTLGGCSGGGGGGGGGSTPAPVVPSIIATDPPDGATDVAPASTVRLILSDNEAVLDASNLIISDGGNVLRGELRKLVDSNVWEWTPDHQVPRGTEIQVVRVQDSVVPASPEVVATFRVREGTIDQSLELAGELPGSALSWPNGRRAIVTASGAVFEVTPTGLVERLVVVPPHARAYGDGSFLGEEIVHGVRRCVRGNLDGTIASVPTPLSVSIGDNNASGDVVAFVPSTIGTSSEWGLWRWQLGDPGFARAGPVVSSTGVDTPSIQSDGTVSMAYTLIDRVRLSRFAIGDLVGEHHELLVAGHGAHFDSADDGSGLLAYTTFSAGSPTALAGVLLHVARYTPGAGLQSFPVPVDSWGQPLYSAGTSSFHVIEDVRVGDLGSGCVLLAQGTTVSIGVPGAIPTPQTNTHRRVIRIEPDDRVDLPAPYLSSIGEEPLHRGLSHVSPARAEVWSVSDFWGIGVAWLTRSRPNAFGSSRIQKGLQRFVNTANWCFSFDDSGRGLMALTAGTRAEPSMRVLLIN